jgi:hypothetical protein
MPNIVQYDSPTNGIEPNDRGPQAFAMEGRRVGAFDHQIGEDVSQTTQKLAATVEAHQSFGEISQLSAVAATTHNSLDASMQAAFKDPAALNNPNAARDWETTTLEPALATLQAGPQTKAGQMYAQEQVARMRTYFHEKAVGTQAQVAGDALVTNLDQTLNQASFQVHSDPSAASGDLARGTYSAGLEAMIQAHPELTAEQVGAFRAHSEKGLEQLTMAQGQGMIDNEVNNRLAAVRGGAQMDTSSLKAMDDISSGGPFANYLSNEQRDQLLAYGRQKVAAMEHDAMQSREALKTQQKQDYQTAAKNVYAAGIQADGTWAPPKNIGAAIVQLSRMPGADVSELREFGNMSTTYLADNASGRLVNSNPTVFSNLMGRIGIQPGQPNALSRAEIYQAAARRQLSTHDASMLTDAMDKAEHDPATSELHTRFNEFITGVKQTVGGKADPMGNIVDPDGAQRVYKLQADGMDSINNFMAQGHSVSEAEQMYLSPQGKGYLGNRLQNYLPPQSKAGLAQAAVRESLLVHPGGAKGAGVPLNADDAAWLAAHRKP